jgi:predicted alpha/beta-hydrolase family hydrolase
LNQAGYQNALAFKGEETEVNHICGLKRPILFVQGERDAFGSKDEVVPYARCRLSSTPAELTETSSLSSLASNGSEMAALAVAPGRRLLVATAEGVEMWQAE